ncbi:MAG: VTT domain-containing protein [Bacteroidetes bacterium]|nr:VTT domain-containing protein [Bacteroidota bacterium]
MSPAFRFWGLPFLVIASVIVAIFLLFPGLETRAEEWVKSAADKPVIYISAVILLLALDVYLPVPSSILLYANGYYLGLFAGSLVSLAGLTVGAILAYVSASVLPRRMEEKHKARAHMLLDRWGGGAIAFTRVVPVLSETVSLLCAWHRMRFSSYMFYHLLGIVPVSIIFAFCGYWGRQEQAFFIAFFTTIALSGLAWWWAYQSGNKKRIES